MSHSETTIALILASPSFATVSPRSESSSAFKVFIVLPPFRVYVAARCNMRASIGNAAGRDSKLADKLFRCVIFPSGWGNIPISWAPMLISLRVQNGGSELC
jgi:hypothetical protein